MKEQIKKGKRRGKATHSDSGHCPFEQRYIEGREGRGTKERRNK
jgi:hypothetical protein